MVNEQSHGSPFAIVPAYLLDASATAVKVYVALALRADHETGECWPKHRRTAADADVSQSTVRRAVKELVEVGALEVFERRRDDGAQTSNLYRLPFAVNRRAATAAVHERTPPLFTDEHAPRSSVSSHELDTSEQDSDELAIVDREHSPAVRKRNEVWDALSEIFGEPSTRTNQKLRGKIVASLKAAGATADEIKRRAMQWPLHFDDAVMTETALEKHYDRLGRAPMRASEDDVRRAERRMRLQNNEGRHDDS